MTVALKNNRSVIWLTLCALFLAVSVVSSLHLAEHDATAPQSKVCSVCLGSAPLDSGLIASVAGLTLESSRPRYEHPPDAWLIATETLPARQRAPPELFST